MICIHAISTRNRVVICGNPQAVVLFGQAPSLGVCRNACMFRDTHSRGLGDTIAKMTSVIGIPPCSGCDKRQRRLNSMVPYNGVNS